MRKSPTVGITRQIARKLQMIGTIAKKLQMIGTTEKSLRACKEAMSAFGNAIRRDRPGHNKHTNTNNHVQKESDIHTECDSRKQRRAAPAVRVDGFNKSKQQ